MTLKYKLQKMIKGILSLSLIFLLISCGESGGYGPTQEGTALEYPFKLKYEAFGEHGFFDPSITFDPTTGKYWMSYSSVETPVLWPTENERAVTTRIAYSTDFGLTWIDSGVIVNNFEDVTLSAAAPNNAGTWHNEVSRIIYDPGADPSERWKLFWHHYLKINGNRAFANGWIGYKGASTPEGLATATELKLFVGLGYNAVNDTQGNPTSQSPLGGTPVQLETLHSELNTCTAFTEPGAFATETALYLSLLCPTVGSDNIVFTIKCDSPCDVDNLGSYSYLSASLNNTVAANIGHLKFSGNEIIKSGDKFYLMVSPVTDSPVSGSYNGCLIFEYLDIDAGTLVGGVSPTVVKEIYGTENSFNGACGYHEGAVLSGFIYSELIVGPPRELQLFLSGETL